MQRRRMLMNRALSSFERKSGKWQFSGKRSDFDTEFWVFLVHWICGFLGLGEKFWKFKNLENL